MRQWKALDETAKIMKPTLLVYKTNENCKNNNISWGHQQKINGKCNDNQKLRKQ